MKKAFISIYVLLLLLVFVLTISFVNKENDTSFDLSRGLYNKKLALYEAESVLNIIVGEKNAGSKLSNQEILATFDHASEIEISTGDTENNVAEAQGAKGMHVSAKYKGTESHAILTYKVDENNKIKIVYKRVY